MNSLKKSRYRSTHEIYHDGLRTIVWFNYINETDNFSQLQYRTKLILKDSISNAIMTEPNNFYDYRNGNHTPSLPKLLGAEKDIPCSLVVFTTGPEGAPLWEALHPYTEMEGFADNFFDSIQYHPKVIEIHDFNVKTKCSRAFDESLSKEERLAYSKYSLGVIAKILGLLEESMTPWQEVIYKIIIFRLDQIDSDSIDKVDLQDLFDRTNIKKIKRWIELEEVICKHYSTINKAGLLISDFAWILLSDNIPYSKGHPKISQIRNNDFSAKYQKVFYETYNLGDYHGL